MSSPAVRRWFSSATSSTSSESRTLNLRPHVANHGSVRTHRGYGRCRVRRCHQSPCWPRHPRHGRPKNTETCRAARYRAQDAHHRAQKFVFKNVSTPIDPAHRRLHHPRGVKNRPLDATPLASPQALGGKPQRTRPSTGRPAHSAWWQGKVPAGKAPQRLGAGLPDPDGTPAMNAATCPSPLTA